MIKKKCICLSYLLHSTVDSEKMMTATITTTMTTTSTITQTKNTGQQKYDIKKLTMTTKSE